MCDAEDELQQGATLSARPSEGKRALLALLSLTSPSLTCGPRRTSASGCLAAAAFFGACGRCGGLPSVCCAYSAQHPRPP